MRQSDRDMLATFIDMADISPAGERLRDDVLRPLHLVGNRKHRRALASN